MMCFKEPDCKRECRECEQNLSVIATLETQLAAANEAVRVLGVAVQYAWYSNDFVRQSNAFSAVFNNPLARASVEKASKSN